MRVVIVRRELGAALSMDVYADALVAGLKVVHPEWTIVEIAPTLLNNQVSPFPRLSGFRRYYDRFWSYPRTVAKLQADIFHIIDHTSGHVAYALKKAGQPVVVTCHDLVQLIYPENTGKTSLAQLSMVAWRYSVDGMNQADHIIAVSTNTKRDIISQLHIAPDQIAVIPNAVESQFRLLPPEEGQALRQAQWITSATICLLNVGSEHPRKNLDTVLEVLNHLKTKGIDAHLWKVGSGFSPTQQQLIQTYGLEKQITNLGKPDKATLIQIYNAADVLLAPSLYEGFGFTILEAMACGTPVVASNVSSLPEVAGDAAILLDPLDVEGMVEAIQHLQVDPTYRQQLIDRGLARATLFTWEKTAEQVAKVYEKLIYPAGLI
jgi:glycosyltransferase involved in cell wall biosynthesis